MALTQEQINRVWENMLAAETRSLYFADLTTRYTRRKQWITGSSFFLSSGAAATLIAQAPNWVPLVLAVATALVNAYSMAINLDRQIATLAKLHSYWNQIASDYDRLWSHTYEEDSESQLDEIIAREREASDLAATDAPHKPELLEHWQLHVFDSYKLSTDNGVDRTVNQAVSSEERRS